MTAKGEKGMGNLLLDIMPSPQKLTVKQEVYEIFIDLKGLDSSRKVKTFKMTN